MTLSEALPVLRFHTRRGPGESHAWLVVAGTLVCVASVAIAAGGASGDAVFGRGLLQLLIVGVPIAVGLYALRAPVNPRFGVAMLGIGFAWSLTALGESTLSVPYTIGRLATWLIFLCAIYLLLIFPSGRIETRLERGLLVGYVGVALALFFATAPLIQEFPVKTIWATCTTDCPANAVQLVDRQPAFMTEVIAVREWLVELLWLGLFYSMFRRWRAASSLQRWTVAPAFIAGTLFGVCQCAAITSRRLGASTDTVVAFTSAWTFCIVAVCAAFLFGLVRRRMLMAGALGRLGVALRVSDDHAQMSDAVATALDDSTMQLHFRAPGSEGWRNARGQPVAWPPELAPGRALTTIPTDDGGHEVALIHDVGLQDNRELLNGVSSMVLAGWRQQQLTADLSRAMIDLEDSRHRIAEAADLERARIERDLHDGAQQRLIALRIRLGLAAERLHDDPAGGVQDVHELEFEAERALEDLRSLARGIYPPVLNDWGLPDALRSVAAQAPMPVHLEAVGVTRQPTELESAVYFACVEALQNALKHAGSAAEVWIELRQTRSRLSFEVRDNGPGFTPEASDGRGVRNMHDRVEAIGGNLKIESKPGHGTRVVGSVQLPQEPSAASVAR